MRTSQDIRKAIENKRATIMKHENRIFEIKREIEVLRNTESKAIHREKLEASNIFINVVSCEIQRGLRFSDFLITTEKGYTFLATKRWKLGKHKITEDWFKSISRPRCPKCNWMLDYILNTCTNSNCGKEV